MSVAVILDFAGGDRARYDTVTTAMGLVGELAPGERVHVAGPYADGWRIVDVWESQERYERFRDEQILPQTQAVGVSPTRVRVVDVDDEMPDDGRGPGFLQCVILPGLDRAAFRRLHSELLVGGHRPPGLTWHVNGPWRSGWCVLDAWVTRESRERFMERISPMIGAAPLSGPPRIEELAVETALHSRMGVAI
ncbi:MAG TPA: hypothetical protein VFN48_04780 [Solirubrobacteraceae bacterium]|nr:hypothetical protein [Solirubrobacteraceae bacterium]